MGVATSHFKALSKKNWIVWKRNLFGSICELMCPLVLMSILVLTRHLIKKDLVEENTLLGESTLWHPLMENTGADVLIDETNAYSFFNFTSSHLEVFRPELYCV